MGQNGRGLWQDVSAKRAAKAALAGDMVRLTGCDACEGQGRIKVPHCPWRLVDEEAATVLELGYTWEQFGTPPVRGGYLDQTAGITEAILYAQREQASWRQREETSDQGA